MDNLLTWYERETDTLIFGTGTGASLLDISCQVPKPLMSVFLPTTDSKSS